MKIAIIAAMSKELGLLLPLFKNYRSEGEYHFGTIGDHEVAAIQSGIGKVNAALATNRLIDKFSPDLVINTGVAGGVGRARPLDVIVPRRVAYHDVWCGPGTVPGQADGCPRGFDCHIPEGIHAAGLLASGDIFISKANEVENILAIYPDAVAVDMESAAIAQTCYLRQTPFTCIRVVSDTPGTADNIAQYDAFWDDAPRATFDALVSLINSL